MSARAIGRAACLAWLYAMPLAGLAQSPDCRTPAAVCESATRGGLALIARGMPIEVLVDDDGFTAVHRAADGLRGDLLAVAGIASPTTGTAPAQMPETTPRTAIIAGTLGRSARIDRIVREHGLDTSGVAGTWEAYLLQVVDHPEPGIDRALVVAGADRRGTAFGLYELSRRIGVSPWTWWADVPPPIRRSLHVARHVSPPFPPPQAEGERCSRRPQGSI